jgi:heat shock protein HslJ
MKTFSGLMTLTVVLCAACVSGPKLSSIVNKDWQLVEARIQPNTIVFDRNLLTQEGFPDIFTLRFNAEQINGIGAPNRYSAPFTTAANQSIAVKTVTRTPMTPPHAPEKLKEHDFFVYLETAYRWNIADGTLELYSRGADGVEAVLVFALKGRKK